MTKILRGKILLPLYCILALQFPTSTAHSQATAFQKIYPAGLNQSGKDVLPTPDGGYLIAASTENSIPNDIDILVVKTNSTGDTLWTKRYGGARPDYPNRILASPDGNYFIVGGSQSFGGGDLDIYLLKVNPSGDTLWTKTYGGFGNEDGNEIISTADGNFVMVGGSNSINFSNNDIQLIKIDPAGAVIWMQYYGGPNYESARTVKLCSDGGFIIAGKTASTSTSVATLFLVRTDTWGDTLWTKKYSGPDSYEGKSILVNSDGSYTLCVDDSSGSRDSDVRVMKLTATGTIIWNYVYGGTAKDIVKMIQPTSDGGYILASVCRSFGWGSPDMWLLRLNPLGDTLWTRHYGGPGHEHCYAVRQTTDGGYIAVGHSKSYTPNTEIMLVKLDTAGNISTGTDELAGTIFMNLYPNPSSNGKVSIALGGAYTGALLKVCDALGQEVLTENIERSGITGSKQIDLEGKAPGVYFVTVRSEKYSVTGKLVLR